MRNYGPPPSKIFTTTNTTYAHVQDLVANDKFLNPMCKHSNSASPQYMLLEMLYVFNLCVVAELSVAHTNSGLVTPTHTETPAPR